MDISLDGILHLFFLGKLAIRAANAGHKQAVDCGAFKILDIGT